MKIAVLGTKGMLAHVMIDILSETNDVTGISLRDKEFNELKLDGYDVVINCVGILVEESEANKSKAVLFNSLLPHLLENKFENTQTKVIHISTDCIFDDTFYGRTKRLGEIDNSKDLTIRTSIIGPTLKKDGNGLFNWFMQQNEVQGYTEAIWNGVTTIELARYINSILNDSLAGVINVTSLRKIPKCDLLRLFRAIFGTKTIINPVADGEDKSLYHGVPLQSILEQIAEMKEYIDARPQKYSHYMC